MICENKGCILWSAFITIVLAMTTSCGAAFSESRSSATSYFKSASSEGEYYYYTLPSRGEQLPESAFGEALPVEYHLTPKNKIFSYEPAGGPFTLLRYNQEPSLHHPFQYNYKQSNQRSTLLPKHLVANIAEQFQSPSLDETAFRMALMNEGYVLKKATMSPSFKSVTKTGSLNVKLPVPFGLTPLNNPPLPLQKGAPIASLPKDVTSYGTRYPQRRRRGSNWHRRP